MAHREAHELGCPPTHFGGRHGRLHQRCASRAEKRDATPRLVADGGSTAGTTRHGITFDRVLDAVDDLGMDPTGDTPIDHAIDVSATDGTLVTFPPGEYRIEERHLLGGIERYGWLGAGTNRQAVRFTTAADTGLTALVVNDGRDLLLENLSFDQRDRSHGSSLGNVFVVRDGLQVRDVEHRGFNPSGVDGNDVTSLAVRVTDPDGVGVIDRFVQVGPANRDRRCGAPAAIWYGNPSGSAGTLYVRDCHVENSPGSGVHASHTNGCVHVEGGEFRNNGEANVRLAGEGSSLREATIVVDTADAHPDSIGEGSGSTGVWVEGGYTGAAGPTIEGCELVLSSVADHSEGLLRVDANAGRTVVRDTHIRNDVSGVHTVYARTPGEWEGTPPEPWGLHLEGVDVSGHGGAGQAVLVEGRDGSTVTDSTVSTERGDGIVFRDAVDCDVSGADITVPGRALVYERAAGSASRLRRGDASEADTAGSADSTASQSDRLRIESADGATVGYRLVVDGTVDRMVTPGQVEVVGDDDLVAVTGWVETDPHHLRVDGAVERAEFRRGDGRLYWNDEHVSAEELTGESLPRRLTVESDGTGVSSYEFTVDGGLAPDPNGEAYTPPENVSGPCAEGAVNDTVDSYVFSGAITSFSLRGLATVRVDGEVVDPTRLGSSPDRDVLRVESRDGRPVGYRITAAGTVTPVAARGPHHYEQGQDGTTVEGRADPVVSWATDGRFVDFEAREGSGRLFLNDALVGPADLDSTGANELRLSGAPGTSYELSVAGALEDGSDARVAGTLGDEPERHRFDGDLTAFSLESAADASVTFRR